MTGDEPIPATPAHHARQPLPRRAVFHVAGASGVILFALGWLVAGYEPGQLYELVRAVAAVAAVGLLHALYAFRVERRLERIEARLSRAEYWRVYSDVMADLGGASEPTSGAPRR